MLLSRGSYWVVAKFWRGSETCYRCGLPFVMAIRMSFEINRMVSMLEKWERKQKLTILKA